MQGREFVSALSFRELMSLFVWCILALLLKLVNLGFAGLDWVTGRQLEQVLARSPGSNARARSQPQAGRGSGTRLGQREEQDHEIREMGTDCALRQRLDAQDPITPFAESASRSGVALSCVVRDPAVTPAARRKWRQVASYIPTAPNSDHDGPEPARTRSLSEKKIKRTCALCPGECCCREYLTAEEWHRRVGRAIVTSTGKRSSGQTLRFPSAFVICKY